MKFLGCFLFLVLCQLVFSQATKRTILDEHNNAGVPYATVKVLHKPIGTMTTAKGEFELAFEPTDTILITSIGYERRILIARDVGLKIYLTPLPKSLDTVVVKRTRPVRTIILGNGKDYVNKNLKCAGDCWAWGPSNQKEEFAERIMVDSTKAYRLQKLYVPTRKKDQYGALLLRIYAEDEITKLPGEELLFKYIEVSRRLLNKNKVVVDLSAQDIYISHGNSFFVSLGWPPGQGGKGAQSTTLSFFPMNKDNTYARNLVSKTYDWYPFGFMKGEDGKFQRINSAYAVELEERTYE